MSRRDGAPGAEKNAVKPQLKEQWCLPPGADAASSWPGWRTCWRCTTGRTTRRRPVVCLDEVPKQLVERGPDAAAGRARAARARYDYEYKREGVANLFMISEPLLGWRHVEVTERRTAKDFAEVLRWVVEDVHPDGREGGAGDGQPEHPRAWRRCTRRSTPDAGAADRREVGVALHAQARELAERGRVRAGAPCRRQCLDRRIGSMARAADRRWRRGRRSGTSGRSGWTGGSPPPTPGSSSGGSTPHLKCVDPLGPLDRLEALVAVSPRTALDV